MMQRIHSKNIVMLILSSISIGFPLIGILLANTLFNRIVNEISSNMDIDNPTVYVYEDYYYGAESYGISRYWIELSAKTIQDFTKK